MRSFKIFPDTAWGKALKRIVQVFVAAGLAAVVNTLVGDQEVAKALNVQGVSVVGALVAIITFGEKALDPNTKTF